MADLGELISQRIPVAPCVCGALACITSAPHLEQNEVFITWVECNKCKMKSDPALTKREAVDNWHAKLMQIQYATKDD